jgi:uncharacterized protein YkwD
VNASDNNELVRLTNELRETPVQQHVYLHVAAQDHAEWMAKFHRMSHRGAKRSTPASRAKHAGFTGKMIAENVAMGQKTPFAVVYAWMRSAGHRRNMTNEAYTSVGFGHAKDKNGTSYWCAVYGG